MSEGERPSKHLPTLDALALQREVVAGLLRSPALQRGDAATALREITEAACQLLGVARAGVWLLASDGAAIRCLDLYDASLRRHEAVGELGEASAPAYFAAVRQARCVSVNDAPTDPRTRELAAGYLLPNGISALLDAPVHANGVLVGVLCHEHVGGPRRFRPHEELIAGTLADLVGTAIGASALAQKTDELEGLRDSLEQLVQDRTRELEESRENVRKLFEASPVALVLTRLTDQSVVLANARAVALFEADRDVVPGVSATGFWADPAARAAMVREVEARGSVAQVEAELVTRKGRRLWGSVSASILAYEGEPMLLVGALDTTAKKRAEELLRRSEETLRAMLDTAPLPLLVTRLEDSAVRFANQRAADMFEMPLAELVGRRAPDFYADPDSRRSFVEALRREGKVDTFAAELRTKAGRPFWALLGAKVFELDGAAHFTVSFADLTEQKAVEARLRELAIRDPLTGAFNRRHFLEVGRKLVGVAERHERPTAAALFDLDHFKGVNDAFGHAVGDEVLMTFARLARDTLREGDVFARWGGEEFAVLLPETDRAAAVAAVERVRVRLAAEGPEVEGRRLRVTTSVGVAVRRSGEALEALLRRADDALYRAKDDGRDRVALAGDDEPSSG